MAEPERPGSFFPRLLVCRHALGFSGVSAWSRDPSACSMEGAPEAERGTDHLFPPFLGALTPPTLFCRSHWKAVCPCQDVGFRGSSFSQALPEQRGRVPLGLLLERRRQAAELHLCPTTWQGPRSGWDYGASLCLTCRLPRLCWHLLPFSEFGGPLWERHAGQSSTHT